MLFTFTRFGGAAALLLVLLSSCGARYHRTLTQRVPVTATQSVNGPATPNREQCFLSPWVPAKASTRQALDGASGAIVRCRDEREFLWRQSGAPIATSEFSETTEAFRRSVRAIAGITSTGVGLCCQPRGPEPERELCVRVTLEPCATRISQLGEQLERLVRHTRLSSVELGVSVSLVGARRARCTPSEPNCGPVPYHGTLEESDYDPTAPRYIRPRRTTGGGTECTHDGECVAGGCGNECVRWDRGHHLGTCQAIVEYEKAPAYCGCVAGICDWFAQ